MYNTIYFLCFLIDNLYSGSTIDKLSQIILMFPAEILLYNSWHLFIIFIDNKNWIA